MTTSPVVAPGAPGATPAPDMQLDPEPDPAAATAAVKGSAAVAAGLGRRLHGIGPHHHHVVGGGAGAGAKNAAASGAHNSSPAVASGSKSSATGATTSSSSSHSVKFQFLSHIGGGSFGEIYSGVDPRTKEKVAIKVESKSVRNPQLYLEYTVYRKFLSGLTGFPRVWQYSQTKGHNYFAMTLLGDNLEALFERCGRRWSAKTLVMVAAQLVHRLEVMHDRTGYLHRDIKPENLLMGQGEQRAVLHLVDLGLAKPFRDPDTKEHIVPRKIRKSLTGTARYASINAHFGRDQSRRDDMESAGYVLTYFSRGRLPWQGLKASNKKQRYEKICEVKMSTSVASLCHGLMPELRLYLDYVRKLSFSERPDYALLRGMFLEVLEAKGLSDDGNFDWMALSGGGSGAEE